jgi:hypothetical protein
MRRKNGHHGVTDEFVDNAVVFHDRFGDVAEVGIEHGNDLFRRHLLAHRREIADIRKQHRGGNVFAAERNLAILDNSAKIEMSINGSRIVLKNVARRAKELDDLLSLPAESVTG